MGTIGTDTQKSILDAGSRIASLDQFRGYTVLGMFFVNFVGAFAVIPAIFKHHNTYCSYADTIMPQFFFAVGFAYRLTHVRRIERDGMRTAYAKIIRRNLGLILLGIVLYHLEGTFKNWGDLHQLGLWGVLSQAFERDPFETLVHIGVTAIWVLPVIAARPDVRIGYMIFSAGLYVLLAHPELFGWAVSHAGMNPDQIHAWLPFLPYYPFAWERPVIDGGPLGFLTWTIPMLVGSLAYDAMVPALGSPTREGAGRIAGRLLGWGTVLMVLGYALACVNLRTPSDDAVPVTGLSAWFVAPPFVPPSRPINFWTMSQRTGSLSYLTFGAGLSLALYALFVWLCDFGPARPLPRLRGLLRVLGWLVLIASVLAVAACLIGLVVLITGANVPMPIEWPDQLKPAETMLSQLDLDGWVVALLFSSLALILSWDLRAWANHSGTVFGSLFQTLGSNALAGYIIHDLVGGAVKAYAPSDAPLWYALAAFGVFLGICYLFIRHLEKHRLFLRL